MFVCMYVRRRERRVLLCGFSQLMLCGSSLIVLRPYAVMRIMVAFQSKTRVQKNNAGRRKVADTQGVPTRALIHSASSGMDAKATLMIPRAIIDSAEYGADSLLLS